MKKHIDLLTSRKFLPMFVTQILGALNDNVLRTAISVYISYKLVHEEGLASFWSNLSTVMFMLPTFLFSAIAGQLADRYRKVNIIRIVKLSEILIILLTSYFLLSPSISPTHLMGCIFLMGIHSAFFSPAKFSYLPEYLETDELLPANGLFEASTFASIALGAALGGLASSSYFGINTLISIMLPISICGWLTSLMIPTHTPQNPRQALNYNFLASVLKQIDMVADNPKIWFPTLGISWFWVTGIVYMTNLTNYTQFTLHYNSNVVILLNSIFTIGIAFGSIMTNKALKGEIHTRFSPISLAIISIVGLHLYSISYPSFHGAGLGNLVDFFARKHSYFIMIDMFLISSFCGIFVVPLYAILQKNSPIEKCAQTIAASNVISALMMICTSIISLLLLSIIGLPVSKLILLISIMNLGLSMYLVKILPFTSVKPILARILRWFFKIEVNGLEHFQTANNRLIIIANHISFLDAILLALFLPDQYIFAINTDIARLPFIRFIQQFFETCEIDPTNPIRIKNLAKSIMSGKKCIIFPEGRLTNTGGIMKIYEGFAALAQMTDADIIPVHLSNSLRHAAKITRVGDRYRQRMSVKVSITVFPAFKPENDPNISAKENRTKNVDEIYDKLAYCQYAAEPRMPIYNALLQAAKDHGYGYNILEDFTSKKKVNYRNVILKSQILGQKIYELTKNESNIGFFLPNTNAGVITFFGMLAYRKVPTMLNYTGGSKNIANSCITAGLKTIVTSRSFISKGNLSEELSVIKSHVDQVIFLEDIANDIRTMDKIKSFWRYLNIDRFYKRNPKLTPPIDSPAVILFTSGSEGSPKGVVLSHRNICANIHQSTATMDLNPTDVMFNALPMFHAFGLNLGTLTPILIGIKTYLYPNPKHYSTVVELIYDTRATLLIGTNTFLSAYLKFSKQYDFSNLRIVFTGGEKLQNETRIAWLEQRGITLLEGYGSTECGPVISSNTLMHHRAGSVGKTLPGIQTRYNPFPDLEIGGELCVRGENIMLGYLLLENPGKIVPLPNGWYDTGDIVSYDEQDFISIIDRIKRFAKISGEMISLSAIEGEVATCWPEYQHGVVSIPDPKRGEKLILITNKPDPDRIELARKLKAQGVSPLSVPNQIEVMDQLPLLSTGKINYPQLIAFIKKVSSKTKTFLRRKS